jgi:hypothetical protein
VHFCSFVSSLVIIFIAAGGISVSVLVREGGGTALESPMRTLSVRFHCHI